MSRLRGRFAGAVSADMETFSSSLEIDLEMAAEDIRGSIAHATMLGECEILSAEVAADLVAGLERLSDELESGEWSPDPRAEDIHMAVEQELTARLGAIGGTLHTARSRNDQVATDLRLWLKRRLAELDAALEALVAALLEAVRADGRTLMPGYTHLQRGQPIWLGHHLLAHAWAVSRDRERLADAAARLDRCPLGACAMAGTAHAIDRGRSAELLGFSGVLVNAMDAVSARDHLQEVAAVCAIAVTTMSRMAAELVLWSSCEFRFVRLSEAYATGSSIMPNKRNPDAAELVRGKVGRVHGDLLALLTMVKGLPLAYNRDLQEDREALFDAVATTTDCATILAGVFAQLEFDRERFSAELQGDFSLATELADALAAAGVPFRSAHEQIAALVQTLEAEGRSFAELRPGELEAIHPCLADPALLDPQAAVERRTSEGGTAWSEIEKQLEMLARTLS